jgi:2-octaprenyl-6-methoxyphenol hydroxylase
MQEDTNILISGAGPAGLIAACAFGAAGFSVICIDPKPPVTDANAVDADLRSTAFLQPSVRLMEDAGIWPYLRPYAAPLQVMRLIDAGGAKNEPRRIRNFDAADISDQPFGWNLPNWLIRREILTYLATLPDVSFRPGCATTKMTARLDHALVWLSDGTRIRAKLAIAADGRDSRLREALGIPVRRTSYGQKALAFAVSHPIPHNSVSTEIHRSGGPFTLVPLPDRDGLPASAVVWMEQGKEAMRLSGLPIPEFEAAMNVRSCHILGPLTLISRRAVWPIISQIADRMSGPRTALIAEAAHVMPPIGAQGLNLSLSDLAELLDLARADRDSLGSAQMLDTYHRRRHPDAMARIAGVDLLNRASMLENPLLRDLRGAALGALHAAKPARQFAMKLGLGLR